MKNHSRIEPEVMAEVITFYSSKKHSKHQYSAVNKLKETELNTYNDILKQTKLIKQRPFPFSKDQFKVTKEGRSFLQRHEIIRSLT